MKHNIFILSLLILTACSKPSTPTSVGVDFSKSYKTVDECGITLTKLSLLATTDYEFGGFCIEERNKFYGSNPISNHDTSHIEYAALIPKDAKLVAIYHTHPSGELSEYYSDADVRTAEKLKIPSFLGVKDNHSIKKFIYSQNEITRCFTNEFEVDCAEGTVLEKL